MSEAEINIENAQTDDDGFILIKDYTTTAPAGETPSGNNGLTDSSGNLFIKAY